MTPLNKKVSRRDDAATVREKGKLRRIVITLYPGGTIGLRPEKTRQEEFISVQGAYHLAVKNRINRERAEKRAVKQAKKKGAKHK
jgi:hypothetical protein